MKIQIKVWSLCLIMMLLSSILCSCQKPDYAAMAKDYLNQWGEKYTEDLTILYQGERYEASMADVTPMIFASSEVYCMLYIEHGIWKDSVQGGNVSDHPDPSIIESKYNIFNLGWGPTRSRFMIVWGDNRGGEVDHYILRCDDEEVRVDLEADYFCNVHEVFGEDNVMPKDGCAYFYSADGTEITYAGVSFWYTE